MFLKEDNVGLKFGAKITDPEVIKKAKNGDLIGWSFGFKDVDVKQKMDGDILVRDVNDIDLVEVSILDRTRSPAYKGNTIELSMRSKNGEAVFFSEPLFYEEEVKEKIDYSQCENLIKDMKGEN